MNRIYYLFLFMFKKSGNYRCLMIAVNALNSTEIITYTQMRSSLDTRDGQIPLFPEYQIGTSLINTGSNINSDFP